MKRTDAIRIRPVNFAHLRRLLLNLHFSESRTDRYWRFEHGESGTLLLFRPYALDDIVNTQDLGTTRMHLDWRGVLSADAFDDCLTKTPA